MIKNVSSKDVLIFVVIVCVLACVNGIVQIHMEKLDMQKVVNFVLSGWFSARFSPKGKSNQNKNGGVS